MLALARQSVGVLIAAVLLAPLSQARPAEGDDDCVHLVGYGGPAPARNLLRSLPHGGMMPAGVCSVDNSRVNRGSPIKTNADFVPVTGDDVLGFYCVYGVRASATGGVGGNVSIYIIELSGGEVLLYGSGYGNIPGANLFDAAYDMERVDQVIRFCMGKDPAQTPLRILVPHGHGDHVNPACNRELERLGYRILEIAFHPADLALINGMSWTSADRALFRMMPAGTTCLQELSSYSSPLGKLWTFHRPGHTAGSIDLVLDILNDPTNRMVIRGSQPSAPCAPVPGQREIIDAHGNVELVSTAPSLADVAPLTGTSLGGTPLTVTGTSFKASGAGQHRVLIDGREASNVVVLNDTTLTCTTPSGPPGQLVQVAVVNNNGKALFAGTFFYNALPSLTSILPTSGDLHGGTIVQVRGSGFLAGGTPEVRFGGALGTSVSIKSDTLLTVRSPAGTPGAAVALTISNENGLATLPAAFRYDTNLAISALAPANGTSLGGTSVVLTGTSFTGTGGTPVVTFGGLPATGVTVLSDTSLSCTAPSGVAGTTVSVMVTNSAGSASFTGYRYNALPRVTALTPGIGRASGGTLITLTGSGFQVDAPGLNQVRFGGVRATQLSVKSDGSLTCLAPAGTAGTTVNVTITNLNGTATLPLAYTYSLPLAVNALAPDAGTSLGGTSVVLTGSGFLNGPAGATTVRFGGVLAGAVNVLDDGSLSCTTPAGTPLALVDVQVSNANGTVTAPAAFRYHAVPTLSAASPDHGHAGAFTPVTLTGSGFLDDDAGVPLVVAGGVTASDVEVLSDTTLACALPPGVAGTSIDLILVNQNGTSTLVGGFRYHSSPTLVSASPASGAATSQLRVTLSGTGFVNDQAGTPTITFGGLPATAVSLVGEQAVRCNAPVGAPGTSVDVVLTNARGSATLVAGYRYHARPRITSVAPNKGTFQGGTAITLSGAGFLSDSPGPNVVTIGGTLASNVVVKNDGTLTCTTPPGVLNAVVDVVVSNANGAGTLAGGFSYSVPAPVVLALNPPSGKASAPGVVQITGSGFQANSPGTNVVRFGGIAASSVTVLDDSTLTCQAPPGTPGARVNVELSNTNGNAQLTQGFRYHQKPALATLVPAAGSALGGTSVQLGGTGFLVDAAGPNLVSFGATPATDVVVVSDTLLTCVAPAGAPGSVQQVTLSNANGETGTQVFAYHALPSLTSLAPDVGPTLGDTLVTLVGTGFQANAAGDARVTFGGEVARNVVVVNDTTLTCRTPFHTQGDVDVVVSNANGAALLAGAFRFGKRPPTLTSVEPASGSSLGKNLVTLRGKGFLSSRTGVNRVKFGNTLSDNVITVDDETVLCSAAPGVAGTTVDVALNNNTGSVTLAGSYRYHPLPTLVSVSPAKGPPLGTGPITLTGTGFTSNSPGETWIRFGNFPAQDVVVLDDTRITCKVVGSTSKSLDVSVSNDNGTATLPGAFEIGAPPKLTTLSPAVGPFTGGTSVQLTGKGFLESRVQVSFGGVLARDLEVLSDTSLRCTTPPGAIGRKVSVNLRTTYGGATLFNAFTYRAVEPDLAGVAPDHGPAAGGTRVTLTGSGFRAEGAGALRVSFGGVPATNVSVLGDTSASCDAPTGTPGALVDVLVENSNGSDVLAGAFHYNEPPSLASLTPASGAAAGGVRVTLQGQGFLTEGAGSNLVLFGGVAALDVFELSDTVLECTTPPGTAGARVDVRLLNQNGEATLPAAFQYRAAPVVTALAPDHGPASGALITLTGTGFQAFEAGTNTVAFGSLTATEVAVVNDTTLTCRAPAGTAGARVDVTVTNANGSSRKAAAFRYHAQPTLTTLTPTRGPAAGGTVVSLAGTGFQSDAAGTNTVLFGSTPATNVVVLNDTTLSCTAPSGSAGALVDVSLQNANGTAVRAGAFRYNALPTLASLAPASGSELGGTTVTLSGTGFVADSAGPNSVFFGITPATGVVAIGDGSLTCVAPAGTPGSTVDVRLANANGSATLSAGYRYNRAPSLTSLTPTSGKAQGGTTVTLNGAGFAATGAGTTLVSFGGVAATAVVVLDDARVQCVTPAGTGGAVVDVQLSNQNGSATLNGAYRRHALPTLSAVAPSRGSSNASSVVTLTGTGFLADGAGTNTVRFGAVPATDVSVLSDTSLVCTVAAQPAGTQADVSVSNANGSVVLAGAFRFDAPPPTLTAVAPASGLAAGGTSVTLTGTGFLAFSAGTNTVTFGGAPATGVLVVSDTTLQCQTPAGTAGTSVDVVVSNVNGSALRAAAFAYLAAGPVLSAVAPASGPAAGGGTVTLTGSGFQASGAGTNTVTFGGTAASNVSVLSDTSLSCTVPAGTGGSTAVVVSNGNGTSTLAAGYRYHALPTITSISPPDGTSLGGTLVTVRGTGFVNDAAGAHQVLFGGTPAASVVVFDDGRLTCRAPSGTGGAVVTITLTNANGTTQVASGFRYHAKPSLSSVTAASGPAVGGNRVTLAGSGFLADGASVNIVSFGGVSATGVSVLGDATIQCNVPAGTAGLAVQVTVANVNGTALLPGGYRYHARPTLTAATPANGPFAGGTSVTLSGSGFELDAAGPNALTFGGVAASGVVVLGDTQLSCITPAGTPSTSVDVVLTNANGSATLFGGFAYDAEIAPIVAGLSPSRGPTLTTTAVRLSGSGFLPGMSVSFDSTPATGVVVVDANTIDCLAPPLAASAWVDVSVAWPEGSTRVPLAFQYFLRPALERLEPSIGEPAGGAMVVVVGSGFLEEGAGTPRVTIGGQPAANVVVYDDQHLSCEVPPGPALTDGDVQLVNDNGTALLARGFRWQRRLATDLDGDGRGDLLLGTPGDDTLGRDAGAVNVFFSTPLPLFDKSSAEADLRALPQRLATIFSAAVAAGDLDGDGASELVIGAPGDDLRAGNAGSVYVFGGPLAASAVPLVPSQARAELFSVRTNDRFGAALCLRDLDRDGVLDLMVGVPGRTPGAVHVFKGGAAGLAPVPDLLIYGEYGNEAFGNSLAAGDLDGDGWPEIVVGAPTAFGPNIGISWNPGEVRIFRGGPAALATLDPQPWIVLHGVEDGERFGASIAVRDLSGDGIDELIVGAPAGSRTGTLSGAVYVFLGGPTLASGSALSAHVVLDAEGGNARLGAALASGDVDGDGRVDLLVGAPDQSGSGRAYLFRGGATLTDRMASAADVVLTAESGSTGEFGNQVALVDVDGNGLDDMIVTAPGLDSFGTDLGRVYVFGATHLTATLPAESAEGKLTGSGSGDQLGRALGSEE